MVRSAVVTQIPRRKRWVSKAATFRSSGWAVRCPALEIPRRKARCRRGPLAVDERCQADSDQRAGFKTLNPLYQICKWFISNNKRANRELLRNTAAHRSGMVSDPQAGFYALLAGTSSLLFSGEQYQPRSPEPRYGALGETREVRLLFVAFTLCNQRIRVLSARPMNQREKKFYGSLREE